MRSGHTAASTVRLQRHVWDHGKNKECRCGKAELCAAIDPNGDLPLTEQLAVLDAAFKSGLKKGLFTPTSTRKYGIRASYHGSSTNYDAVTVSYQEPHPKRPHGAAKEEAEATA